MKNFNIKSMVSGIIIGVCISTSLMTAFAAWEDRQITASFRNIKIDLDGVLFTPKDANGTVVEPFIYNGTTYVPIRAVSQAFGYDVGWDAENETVLIETAAGSGTSVHFELLEPVSTFKNGNIREFTSTDRDIDGNAYSNGIILSATSNSNTASYALNKQYSTFTGNVVPLPTQSFETADYSVHIYGDGELLYSSSIFSKNTHIFSENFDVDVSSVDLLEIELIMDGSGSGIGLVDAILIK